MSPAGETQPELKHWKYPHRIRNDLRSPVRSWRWWYMWEEDKKETDQQTFYKSPGFIFSLPIFYSHHDFLWNLSPGLYGVFMFSFLSPSVKNRICFYWFRLWSLLIFLLCCHQAVTPFTNTTNTLGLPPPFPLHLCSGPLLHQSTKGESGWLTWPQLLPIFLSLFIFPSPHLLLDSGHCFSSPVTKACKRLRTLMTACPCFISCLSWEIGGNYIFIDQVTP